MSQQLPVGSHRVLVSENGGYECTLQQCHDCGFMFDQNKMRYSERLNYYCKECSAPRIANTDVKVTSAPVRPVGIPEHYSLASIEDYSATEKRKLIEWPSKRPFMIIKGPKGVGKTRAACALLKEIARRGYVGYFERCIGLKSRWLLDVKNGRDQVEKFATKTRFLVLDDITAPTPSDGWVQFLQGVLDERIGENLPTLITCMAGDEEIVKTLGGANGSRIQHFSRVIFQGDDKRKVIELPSEAEKSA